ncbi:MAG: hypothetical protein F4X64_11460 [Chloroflexi bacterium]|nr:hypothetical protein [Chloroflexota bacterium]
MLSDMSLNTICFQAICRDYRNAVVNHVRASLEKAYPDDWEEQMTAPFRKEWEVIRANAQVSRSSGEHEAQLRDEADLLGVNHFYNLFELHFDVLFPAPESVSEADRKALKQAVLSWSRNIKVLRDPVLGHPGEDDITEADAMMMLDSARRILENFDTTASEQVRVWWERIRSSGPVSNIADSNDIKKLEGSILPSREAVAPRFVGRQAELSALNEWLLDDDSQSWFLAGDGGKGKTAIAYEFAVSVRDNPPPNLEIVIWLTAKARRFSIGSGIEINDPDFWDLGSALDGVLDAYGVSEIENMDLNTKRSLCMEYLNTLPALLVLDDVDSLEGSGVDAMNFFLLRLASTSSKVLFTSRRIAHYGMEPMTTQVQGFAPRSSDGIDFVRTRIDMFGLDPGQFPTSLINNILEACDGSPLFVQDLLRLCKVGEMPGAAIDKWKNDGGEEARRYALGREFEKLSDAAQKVLLACSLSQGPASLPEIRVAVNLRENQCHEAITELQTLFLIPRPRLVEDVPRFAINANTRRLVLEVLGGSDLAARISNSINAIRGDTPANYDQRRSIGQYIRLAVSQVKLEQYKNAEETILRALEAHPENPDLRSQLGWVYRKWQPTPRITDARFNFSRAADLKSRKEDTYLHWANMESQQREWTSAAIAAEKGLDVIGNSSRLSSMAGYARSMLARDLQQQTLYPRADQEARQAEEHLKNALLSVEEIEQGDYKYQSRTHRAMAINYERLIRINRRMSEHGTVEHFTRLLANCLNRWLSEHPSDPDALSERDYLLAQHPDLIGFGLATG